MASWLDGWLVVNLTWLSWLKPPLPTSPELPPPLLSAVPVAAPAPELPSLPRALAVFALFFLLEVLQRWVVLRPVSTGLPPPCRRRALLTPPAQAERRSAVVRELTREARELRRRAAELSAPSTFPQSAKIARAAGLKEKEVEHLRASAALRRRRLPALTKAALQAGAVYTLWGAPVLSAPGPPLGWPLDAWLAGASIGTIPGAVGALPFALLCGRVASLLARVLLPP
jgi:hypothetical protein